MRFEKPSLRQSFWAWIAPERAPVQHDAENQLVEIRRCMLAELRQQPTHDALVLSHRILAARDAQTLWYLRPALMEELCKGRGEGDASRALARITAHFRGLVTAHQLVRRTTLSC